ncbi:MAG: hypothetical protein RLZZ292_3392 [Bacteroidota bacterium]|jgi:predicted nuclease of restriction endonuclease-like (RecB) superfamily
MEKTPIQIAAISQKIVTVITQYMDQTRLKLAVTLSTETVLSYWYIGKAIEDHLLNGQRAKYGQHVITSISSHMTQKYGRGFSYTALTRMMRFYRQFPDIQIVATLSQQLSWSHFVELLPVEDTLKRNFYLQLCLHEHWSLRVLREKIDTMLYERTALSKLPENTILNELQTLQQEGTITPELVFRDPYILDFLELKDTFSEYDLETAILNHLQTFIIELGSDFAFLARQKRIIIDGEDFYIDLLFYHRGLKRLIAIDLKLGRFKAAYKGQMELYLRWLDKYERKKGEESPIGLILCSEKRQEQIELLELDQGAIRVAQYLTELPSKEILAEKLHKAILIAQNNTIHEKN